MILALLSFVPPIVFSPYVLQPQYVPAPISDESGYVITTSDCKSAFDNRIIPKGTVMQMIVNPNGHPHTDPSVWGIDYQNNILQGVRPVGGKIAQGFYLPVKCLEGRAVRSWN